MRDIFILWITIQLVAIGIFTGVTAYNIEHNKFYCSDSDISKLRYWIIWATFPLISFIPEREITCIKK